MRRDLCLVYGRFLGGLFCKVSSFVPFGLFFWHHFSNTFLFTYKKETAKQKTPHEFQTQSCDILDA